MTKVGRPSITVAAISAIVLVALMFSPVAATPPCPPLGYFASYARPVWSVTLFDSIRPFDGSSYLSLEISFYSLRRVHDQSNLFTGPYRPIAPTTLLQPTTEEPFAYRDHDGDWNVSRGDEVIIYDPSAAYRDFLIGWGRNETSLGMIQGFQLRHNYWVACRTVLTSTVSPPDQLTFPTISLIVMVVLGSQLLLRVRHARFFRYKPLFRHQPAIFSLCMNPNFIACEVALEIP